MSFADICQIVLVSVLVTGVVASAELLLLRLLRRASVAARSMVVAAGAIISVVGSVLVIAAQMYLSEHDAVVLLWVASTALVLSLLAAWLVGRSLAASIGALRRSALGVAGDAPLDPARDAPKEVREVSEQLAEANLKLAAARQELKDLEEARSLFFAWITHDLRTPITGIRALAEALDVALDESQSTGDMARNRRDYTQQMLLQADRVSRLVDDLFELSRLQAGAFQLSLEQVDVADVVSDAVADLGPTARALGLNITGAEVADVVAWIDPHAVTRAVTNLLGNAIKYAPGGSEIAVSVQRDGTRMVRISVRDHGPGVSDKALKHMFDVGWRDLDAELTSTTPAGSQALKPQVGAGAGLGLAIVKGITEAHGGSVQARVADPGLDVSLLLPLGAGV